MIGNTWKQIATQLAVLAMFNYTDAKIKINGIWTQEEDWYNDEAKIGVKNGVPYSKDADMARRMDSAMALEGNPDDYKNFENVKRVDQVLGEDDFDKLFPIRNELYTYDGLLQAVGKFPKFCGESNFSAYDKDLDMTCKRELSTLFAHITQETGRHNPSFKKDGVKVEEWNQGLYHISSPFCDKGGKGFGTTTCGHKNMPDEYPSAKDKQFFSRGPFQIAWDNNYGAFSEVLNDGRYDSKMDLLQDPDQLKTDSYTSFASALWQYMNPRRDLGYIPTQHDVVTGFMIPTEADIGAGMGDLGFGTTTAIMNRDGECGWAKGSEISLRRVEYYTKFLEHFDLPEEDEDSKKCAQAKWKFPRGGYGDIDGYWAADWNGKKHCRPVGWLTQYPINTRDSYKRCICDSFGNGAEDCAEEPIDCKKDPGHEKCPCTKNPFHEDCPVLDCKNENKDHWGCQKLCKDDPWNEKCPEINCKKDPKHKECVELCSENPKDERCPEPDCKKEPDHELCPCKENPFDESCPELDCKGKDKDNKACVKLCKENPKDERCPIVDPVDCNKDPENQACADSGRTGDFSKFLTEKDIESLDERSKTIIRKCAIERAEGRLTKVENKPWQFNGIGDGEKGHWTGEWFDSKPHGEGVFTAHTPQSTQPSRYVGYAVKGQLEGLLRREWISDDKTNFLIFQRGNGDSNDEWKERAHTVYQADGKVCNFHDCSKDDVEVPEKAKLGNGKPNGKGMAMLEVLPSLDLVMSIDGNTEVQVGDDKWTWNQLRIAAMEPSHKDQSWYKKLSKSDKLLVNALREAQSAQTNKWPHQNVDGQCLWLQKYPYLKSE